MRKTVVHVAEVEVSLTSGMGRVAWHWREEFQRRGYEFIHLGPEAVGPVPHKALFPRAAYQRFRAQIEAAAVCLVHEPASAPFARKFPRTIVFSHGLERRGWNAALGGSGEKIKFRSRILFPLWRIRPAEYGMRRAKGVMLVNHEDADFVRDRYGVPPERLFVFRNGVDPESDAAAVTGQSFSVIFTGSWIARKGIHTLVRAAELLEAQGCRPAWTLLGTVVAAQEVLSAWPERFHSRVQVIPRFAPEIEGSYLRKAAVFVLPSFSEGQPLALLQAMESGCCCVTTNCCGQRDVITHEENGLLFTPGDAPALAGLLRRALEETSLRARLGGAARASVADRRWPQVSSEVVDHMEMLAGIPSTAR